MNAERWERIAQLHGEAIARDRAQRRAFLDAAAGGDDELRREVASLLAEEDSQSVLDAPMLESAAAVLDHEITLAPGTRLNQYEIDHLLGAGGMGDVYRARDTKLGREVALKLLWRDVDADARMARSAPARGSDSRFAEPPVDRRHLRSWRKAFRRRRTAIRPMPPRFTRSSWSSSRDRRSRSGSPSARSRSTMRSRSPRRSRAPCRRRTSTASCTAI